MNLCEPRFEDKISTTKLSEIVHEQKERSREVGLTGNREIIERPWNLLASLDLGNHNFVLGNWRSCLLLHSNQSIRWFYAEYLAQVILHRPQINLIIKFLYIGLSYPKKNVAVTMEKYLPLFPFLWKPVQFFSRWKLLPVSASKLRKHFLWETNILSHEYIKACSWCQVRRLNFTGVLLLLYFPLNQPLWTPQCRLLPVDNLTQPLLGWGQFVVETRLAKIHVCTSNENTKRSNNDQYNNEIRQITFISTSFWFVAIWDVLQHFHTNS